MNIILLFLMGCRPDQEDREAHGWVEATVKEEALKLVENVTTIRFPVQMHENESKRTSHKRRDTVR